MRRDLAPRPPHRYVDPVDGTYNFLSGVPYWCSAVGLVADDPVIGAVYYPAMDELWVGGPDRPTTMNGQPVEALANPLSQVSVATYFHPRHLRDQPRVTSWRRAVGGGHRTDVWFGVWQTSPESPAVGWASSCRPT